MTKIREQMKFNLWLLFFIFSFSLACSPTKRINRLINKHPHLAVSVDTTIYFQTNSADTSFIFRNYSTKDTFYIQDTKTKIFRHYDTITVKQESIRDTVRLEKTTVLTTDPEQNQAKETAFKFGFMLIAILILLLFIKRS